jgi:hypothetical protein
LNDIWGGIKEAGKVAKDFFSLKSPSETKALFQGVERDLDAPLHPSTFNTYLQHNREMEIQGIESSYDKWLAQGKKPGGEGAQVTDIYMLLVIRGDASAEMLLVRADVTQVNLIGKVPVIPAMTLELPSAEGYTTLWRAVENPELDDILKYGDYNIHPNSIFKRFALGEKSLDDFIAANPGRTYTKTSISIPTLKLDHMVPHADTGGVGNAVGIDVHEHPEFYDSFNGVDFH